MHRLPLSRVIDLTEPAGNRVHNIRRRNSNTSIVKAGK
jgi:hypothetical protein